MREAETLERRFALADLLDRVLAAGVVLSGHVILSVAEVDLVYLNLQALLASVESVRDQPRPLPPRTDGPHQGRGAPPHRGHRAPLPPGGDRTAHTEPPERTGLEALERFARRGFGIEATRGSSDVDVDVDGERVARGLAKLVLVLVDQLRELMERQAIRRMEAGSLSPEQTERLGDTFSALERSIEDMKARFGLDDDLSLGLEPGSVHDLG